MNVNAKTTWETYKLSQLVKFASGGTPNRQEPRYWNGDIPWLSAKDLKHFHLTDSIEKVTEEGARNGTRQVSAGAVMILVRGMTLTKDVPVGVTCRTVAFNQDIKALIPNEKIRADYLAYYLSRNKSSLLCLVDRAGHGTGRLATDLLSDFDIEVPPLYEQKRIAAALSLWDRAIGYQTNLIAAETQFNRGLAQQLLTGARRFPEFVRDRASQRTKFGYVPNDWNYLHIGDIAREVSEKNTSGEALTVLSCTKHRGLVDSLVYFGKQVFSKDTSTYKVVRRGQFAYATNHIEEGSIGYQNRYDKALISPMYTVFEINEQVDDAFFYKLLKTELYRRLFKVNTSASVDRRGSLRWKEFAAIKVALPSIEEQRCIAAVLGSCDQHAELLKKRREIL
ncbi:MAG TPA: restriction endonuclease subunit S, partial [Pyrinomonadaceae bacterium]|nr:restriction endonuclease subunit S [Pyrinomonadaceae bacterium]